MAHVPALIGRYPVTSTLGIGGFAVVYLGEDPRLDTKVAIKILTEDRATQLDVRTRFIAEARIMRRLATARLVAIHDIDEHDGRPFFVMEYCQQGTLEQRLEGLGRPINLVEAQGLARALAMTISEAHTAGVVHRDLKPSNFLIRLTPNQCRPTMGDLLTENEELVVADFGLAKNLKVDASRITLAGGTPGFSAPEQFRGEPSIDTRADVYALSAILASAISGEKPRALVEPNDQAFSERAFEMFDLLGAALKQGLDFDPANRQADATEWLQTTYNSERAPKSRRSRVVSRRSIIKFSAVALTTLSGVSVLVASPIRLHAPDVIGPKEGAPGDEAVFFTNHPEPVPWTVNSQQEFKGRIVSISPSEPGVYWIEVKSSLRSTRHAYTVLKPLTKLRIDGPGYAPVNQNTRFTAAGVKTGDPTWTINGTLSTGHTIEVQPNLAGPFTMTLTAQEGENITRTITAVAPKQ